MMRIFIFICFILSYSFASAQSLDVFDLDTSDFPTMKAKFYAKNKEKNQLFYLDKTHFIIYENGSQRKVLDVNCADTSKTVPLSSLLAIDVSGSMGGRYLDLAADAARAWLEVLPFENSECAITAFGSNSEYLQSFTQEKYKLLSKLNFQGASGQTNFDAAFLSGNAAGLPALEHAIRKRVMLLITDGNGTGDADEIVEKANEINATVFCVAISPECPPILKDISQRTGGLWFENINNPNLAADVYRQIFEYTQIGDPCTIEWESYTSCEKELREVEILCPEILSKDIVYYDLPEQGITALDIMPNELEFGKISAGNSVTKQITVTAMGADFNINNVSCNDPSFSIRPNHFVLPKGQQITLDVTYNSSDDKYKVAKFTFEHSFCQRNFFCRAGDWDSFSKSKSLKVVSPNGGELFALGIDTTISWEGALPSDKVNIAISRDNGTNWEELITNATGMKAKWKKIQGPASTNCLVQVSMKTPQKQPKIKWEKSFGQDRLLAGNKIIKTKDNGYVIVGRTIFKSVPDYNGYEKYDAYIMKLDSAGNILWKRSFGGSGNETANSIKQTNDDGFIIVGTTDSKDLDFYGRTGEFEDIFVMKLDKYGIPLWHKFYGGTSEDQGNDIIATGDGGYIISATTKSKNGSVKGKSTNYPSIWTFKIDSNASIVWQNIYDKGQESYANSLLDLEDNSFLLLGNTINNDPYLGSTESGIVRKVDGNGNQQWLKIIDAPYSQNAISAVKKEGGNFLVLCSNEQTAPRIEGVQKYYWLVEFYPGGTIKSKSKLYGGTKDDIPSSIIMTKKGDFVLVGNTQSDDGDITGQHGSTDIWLTKLSKNKSFAWGHCLGGSKKDEAYSIIEAADGDFIITGQTNSNDGDVKGSNSDTGLWVVKVEDFDTDDIITDASNSIFTIATPTIIVKDLDIGKVVVGKERDSTFNNFILNTGSLPCQINDVAIGHDSARVFKVGAYSSSRTLKPGDSQSLSINFEPQSVGMFYANVRVTMGDKEYSSVIKGEGIASDINLVSNIVDFGTIQVFSNKDTLSNLIKNTSDRDVQITDFTFDGYTKEHFEVLDFAPFTLAAGQTHEFLLRYTPTVVGRSSAFATVHYNGVGETIRVKLYGAGVGAKVSASIDSAKVGENVNIRLELNNSSTERLSEVVGSFECTLKFETSILGIISNLEDVKYEGDSTFITIKQNIDENNSTLASIPMVAMLGKVKETRIKITDFKWFDLNQKPMFFESDFADGNFKLLELCEQGGTRLFNPTGDIKIASLSPNPAINQIEIDFSLAEKGQTEITVTNLLGETVATLFSENISEVRDMKITRDISKLGSGQYFISLKTPTYMERRKLIIIK